MPACASGNRPAGLDPSHRLSGERTISSITGVGKSGNSHVKVLYWTLYLRPLTIIHLEWIKVLSVRPESIKLLEENIGTNLLGIGLGNDFLDMTPKVQATKAKIKKWDYINLKSFCTAKEIINKMKKQAMEWEKIFANHVSGKGLISKVNKELMQLNSKNQITGLKSGRRPK
uniref:Uncharacterized protein n=1 Tax=Equus caballus TaxID=9796 RepID=A0A9L0RZ97_HORSE